MSGENSAVNKAALLEDLSASGRRVGASFPVRQQRLHYGALVFLLMLLILVAVDSDAERWPAAAALACAFGAMMICLIWAIKISRMTGSDAAYVKATTTSRVMVWFWLALGATTLMTALLGIHTEDFMPLFEDALIGFIGIGSILLTAGPAYAEYMEAQHATVGDG